ncbi:MAG: Gx transporter family protein [Coriobacteriia bacterium]|nr:Gx transporter family protein [Coriobacteriia bacterium]
MRPTPSSAETGALVATAMLVAVAAVLGLLESAVFPPLPVPGVRLGVANLAVVLALAYLGPRRALQVSLGRVLIVGLAAGTLGGPGALMALAGALASWGAMSALARWAPDVSPLGWSVAGAAIHVLAQLAAAAVLAGTPAPLLLAPISLGLALACGLAVGYCASLLLSRLPHALPEVEQG